METKHFCQSCGMPIDDPQMQGSERDGSKNTKYCVYCFADGRLVNPDMTLTQMTDLVRRKLQEMHLPEAFIAAAVKTLPRLERWVGTTV